MTNRYSQSDVTNSGGTGVLIGSVANNKVDITIPEGCTIYSIFSTYTSTSVTPRILGIRHYNATKAVKYWESLAWVAQNTAAPWNYSAWPSGLFKTSSTSITMNIPKIYFDAGDIIEMLDVNNVSITDNFTYAIKYQIGRP